MKTVAATPRLDTGGGGAGADAPVVVRVEGLAVRLSLQKEKVTSLREQFVRTLQRRPIEAEEFWPLRDVSFEVRRGEAFGIVGRNGAGKSTLLKVIAGVVAPTLGRVEVNGRIAPLLELGAGFDPEMTGRENIFLYGSLLGFPKRALVERFDRIVQFAELAEFIDVPLKNYSTGMVTRLGFAIASDVDADLLIVDEVLTVGDARFQRKCMERIKAFMRRGVTILFVSHNPEQIEQICARALWLHLGVQRMCGDSARVTGAYMQAELEPETGADTRTVTPGPVAAGAPAPRVHTTVAHVLDQSYDFVDLSMDGSSASFCAHRFGGKGLGISANPVVVDSVRRAGFDALNLDPFEVDFPEHSFRYASIVNYFHFMPGVEVVEIVLAKARRWARDFLYVRTPSFEDEAYLRSIGLKLFWYDWRDLRLHLRMDQFFAIFQLLGLHQYNVVMRYPALSSDVPSFLPLTAPPDQVEYDPLLHGPKPHVAFVKPVFEQIDILVALRPFDADEWRSVIDASNIP